MSTLAERLKQARSHAGLTQCEVAKRARITQCYLSQIETGTRTPSIRTLQTVARVLQVRAGDLLSGGS